jgi:hypothetical protein
MAHFPRCVGVIQSHLSWENEPSIEIGAALEKNLSNGFSTALERIFERA